MTLRLRLVGGLVVLLTVGLALFGIATYLLYRQSEYQRLDAQVRNVQPLVDAQLDAAAGLSDGYRGRPPGPGPGGPPPVQYPIGVYGQLRSYAGAVLATLQPTSAAPRLPQTLPPANGHLFTVGSSSGSGQFRCLVVNSPNGVTLVAIPTTEVAKSMHKLVLIEALAAAGLLVVLSGGSWLILRRGLRPLERMAGTARSITAGDLSQRVTEAGPTEVGQLGLALNTMLDDIEVAFKEREETELRLRQFLADASHELRTPLTSIQGFAELFRLSGDKAPVDLPTVLRRIEEESARMRDLVEDLLLLARLDQTRDTERAPVDLAVLAADACSDAVAHAPDRGITLDAPEPVVVAGDEAHLRQAISNLVTNATRHTPEGSAIEVGAHLRDGAAVLTVRDHGPGLDAEALTHVFDRFWQGDRARSGPGAGLGLSIVAGIAAEHAGMVEVANADGGGAVFTLRLPVDGTGGAARRWSHEPSHASPPAAATPAPATPAPAPAAPAPATPAPAPAAPAPAAPAPATPAAATAAPAPATPAPATAAPAPATPAPATAAPPEPTSSQPGGEVPGALERPPSHI
jgi:two-component system OmpR family sensor kinase